MQRKGSDHELAVKKESTVQLDFPKEINNDFETGSQDSPKKSRIVNFGC